MTTADRRTARHRTARLTAAPAAVPQARRLLTEALADWGVAPGTDLAYDLRLIVSELAAVSVRNADRLSPTLTLTMVLGDGHIGVGVHDADPRAREAHCDGLGVVHEVVAEAHGIAEVQSTEDGGKTTWVVLPLGTGPATG
ncbi:ATP-binding protein [Yinghuangia sp. ASG 101]|uniref:ATP-binding protein n=1 Tax=Yinghuangia sp. ASG 101 TaxID=2896848 RepID=UPI001E4443B1|nr:ATP-binding protein [Yinghuangia sp. ASG 101]UGQ09493.1 ATP-binding protein [Yinghuangia sp. ASG 101]